MVKKPEQSDISVRYELDPYNRLVAVGTKRQTGLFLFRRTLSGRFKLDKNNSLFYVLRAPADRRLTIPRRIRLGGDWSLDERHNLRLSLDQQSRQTLGDKLTIAGVISDVTKNSLLFTVSTRGETGASSDYTLKLEGAWQADSNNRLVFRVNKQAGSSDILTLNNAWIINKHQRIVYEYKKSCLSDQQKITRSLMFKGYWDIRDKTRLYYTLDKKTGSGFAFQAGAGIFKANYIKYYLDIGVRGIKNPVERVITLQGSWKIKKGIGLTFEVKYEKQKIEAIAFGAQVELTKKDELSLELKNQRDQPLAAQLTLSRKMLKGDGEAFLSLLKSKQESGVFVGAGFRW